jgi:hypothetical protein
VFRPKDLARTASLNGPFWLSFEAGEEIPLYADIAGPLFELHPKKPVTIRIKRSFFLLLGDGRPRISLDRRTLLDGGGSFRFGVGASKERGTFAEVVVRHQPDLAE